MVVELTRRADRAVSPWAAADTLAQSLPLVVLGPVRRQVRARDYGHDVLRVVAATAQFRHLRVCVLYDVRSFGGWGDLLAFWIYALT